MERTLHAIGYSYLGGDVGVASHIFYGMNNPELAKFVRYLCERFETDKTIKKHVNHFISGFDILRENRNIVQHAVPSQPRSQEYSGLLVKATRKGLVEVFDVPIDDLKRLREDLSAFLGYGRTIQVVMEFQKKDVESLDADVTQAYAAIGALEDIGCPSLPKRLRQNSSTTK